MRGKLWNFIRPADPKKVMRFENTGEDFSAMYQAQHWLHENGYRDGSSDRSNYIPAMKGERYTLPQKLYNFDREDYDRVSAVMTATAGWRFGLWNHGYRILHDRDVVMNIHCFSDVFVHKLQHALGHCDVDKEIIIKED